LCVADWKRGRAVSADDSAHAARQADDYGLGGLAEFERHLILSWTNEGRQRAKANGIKFGKKPKLNKHQRDEALARKRNGETLTEIAKTYNVSHMTLAGSDWSTRTAAFSAVSDRRGSFGVAHHMHSGI